MNIIPDMYNLYRHEAQVKVYELRWFQLSIRHPKHEL